jgi:osmotically-inducible protein OsmY
MNSIDTVKNVVLPVAALLLVGTLSGCATFGEAAGQCTTSACSTDAKLTSDVQTSIKQNPEFGANRVHVQTLDGVVYLRGTLSGGEQRADAELAALQTPGVGQVVNDITVTK